MNIMNQNKMKEGALRVGVCLLMLSGTNSLYAQTEDKKETKVESVKEVLQEISGVVYDAATKVPLAGVQIQALNNSKYAAMTDENGAYTIRLPKHVTTLYISAEDYNGVKLSIKADNNQNAYLYTTKVKGLYSNSTDLFNRSVMSVTNTSAVTVENDIENYLNASVRTINRGGMPAQGAAMFINGLNSLNINSQPMVVIDGVIVDMQYDRTTLHDGFINNLFNILDPEDIESVEVIKNGTALYGAKGGNGVLEIKTKRGKSMVTRINIRAYGGYELAPTKMDIMNASQYRNYVTEFLGTSPSAKYLGSSMTIPFMNEDPNYIYYKMYHNETDWQGGMYENAFTQNYKVSVEGGDDVAMYNLSLGYTQSDATAKKNDFNRLNIRFNTDINMFKDFTTGLDLSYSRNAYNLRDNGWAADYSSRNISSPNVLGLIQSPFISPYAYFVTYEDNQMSLIPTAQYAGKDYNDSNNPFVFANSFGYSGLVNPYWILSNGQGDNKNFQEQTQFNLNIAPKYKINQYLTVSDRFSYILNRSNEKYYLPYSGTPPMTVEGLGDVTSIIRTQFAKETTLFNDFRVDWKRQFGANYFNVFGGFRLASYSYSDSRASGYNNDNDKMPNMNMALQYKDYGGTNDSWLNLAYYANVDYNYKNKYFVKAMATMESSSRFGRDAKDGIDLCGVKWGLFPSIQGAWVISSEKWFNVAGVDYLKLSAGYEMSGNDNVDYYASRTYFENLKFLDKATALQLANIQNPEIQWETNHRFNVGLQGAFLNNRLSLGLDYYRSKTTDLLTRKAVSDITGLAQMWVNDGEMENNGLEATIHALLVNTKNWKWQAGFSIGHYQNKVTKLPSSNTIEVYALNADGSKDKSSMQVIQGYTTSIYGQNNVLTAVGEAAGVFYGYKTAGVFASDEQAKAAGKYGYLRYPTGLTDANESYRNFKAGDVRFVDVNGDGWISEADKVKIGDPNPDIYGNFYTSVSWKNLTLDVNFKYSLGNDVFNYQRSQMEASNNIWNQTTAVVNRWKYEGHVTEMPRAMSPDSENWVNNERFSDRWIEDGSYLKLKKVRLTYKLPINLSWLLGLTVWGEANNVVTLTKYLGSDPEVSCGNGVLTQGIDAGLLPQSRNFNLGVTINL